MRFPSEIHSFSKLTTLSISSVSMLSGSASKQQSISSWTSFANLAFFDRWICLHAVVGYTSSPEHTSQGQWTWPLDFGFWIDIYRFLTLGAKGKGRRYVCACHFFSNNWPGKVEVTQQPQCIGDGFNSQPKGGEDRGKFLSSFAKLIDQARERLGPVSHAQSIFDRCAR